MRKIRFAITRSHVETTESMLDYLPRLFSFCLWGLPLSTQDEPQILSVIDRLIGGKSEAFSAMTLNPIPYYIVPIRFLRPFISHRRLRHECRHCHYSRQTVGKSKTEKLQSICRSCTCQGSIGPVPRKNRKVSSVPFRF